MFYERTRGWVRIMEGGEGEGLGGVVQVEDEIYNLRERADGNLYSSLPCTVSKAQILWIIMVHQGRYYLKRKISLEVGFQTYS